MATYRQKLKAQEEAANFRAVFQLRAKQESAHKMSMSPAECYSEGYAIGFEHGTDGYEGTASALASRGIFRETWDAT